MTNKVTCSEKSDTESNSRTKRIEEKMSNDSNRKILKAVEHHWEELINSKFVDDDEEEDDD